MRWLDEYDSFRVTLFLNHVIPDGLELPDRISFCLFAGKMSYVACSANTEQSLTSTYLWITTPDNQEDFPMSSIHPITFIGDIRD